MQLKRYGIVGILAAVLGVAQPLSAVPPLGAEETGAEALAAATPAFQAREGRTLASGTFLLDETVLPPPAPPGFAYWKTVRAKVTAYDPHGCCCDHSADGRTSLGDDAWHMDGVAVAPEAVPYRSKVWIPGAGWKEADDTGSAMRRSWRRGAYHMDLRVARHDEARRWGTRNLPVHLYRPVP